jgi:DNA-binding response OmpR family regulator
LFEREQPDWVILDWHLDETLTGKDLALALIERGANPCRLVMVSASTPEEIGTLPIKLIAKQRASKELLAYIQDQMAL